LCYEKNNNSGYRKKYGGKKHNGRYYRKMVADHFAVALNVGPVRFSVFFHVQIVFARIQGSD
jgi:hypothetical protein